jgi:peptide/nickel transport system substrate-binding protein
MKIRAAHFAAVDRIEAADLHTLIIRLKEPFAPLLTYLAHPMNAIVDRNVIDENGGRLDRADAGSGPFKLVEWRKDQHLIVERHTDYDDAQRPSLARVVFLPMSDATARTTALRNGEIDLILDVTPKDARVLEKSPGLRVPSVPGTFWQYVGLNTSRKPLGDVRVRQAIAWAIDRQALNQVVNLGRATILDGGHIPPGHWAYGDLHLYPQRDLAKARTLLAEAGVGDGFKVVCKVGSAFPYQVAAGQMVKQQLREVGIEVQLLAQESSVFFDALGKKDFDLTVCGWVGFVDPDEWTYELFHSKGMYNQQAYANPAVDALLEQGRGALDRNERHRIYRDAQEIIAREAPMIFLYANNQTSAYQPDLNGFVVQPTASTLSLRDASVPSGDAQAAPGGAAWHATR